MLKFIIAASLGVFSLQAHCQMPCGIYHDSMVYSQIDQYIETMVKGVTVLRDSKFSTAEERNEFVRWVLNKDRMSDETAQLITTYFLQQKIKPDEESTPEMLVSAHKLLFTIVAIKQTVDEEKVQEFFDEWEKFKLFFHVDNYECLVDKQKYKEWDEKRKVHEQQKASKKTQAEKDHEAMHKDGVEHHH